MKAIEKLKAVLCDAEGNVCCHGSDGDRAVIAEALEEFKNSGADTVKAFAASLLIEVGGTDDGCTPVISELLGERITAYADFYARNEVEH